MSHLSVDTSFELESSQYFASLSTQNKQGSLTDSNIHNVRGISRFVEAVSSLELLDEMFINVIS